MSIPGKACFWLLLLCLVLPGLLGAAVFSHFALVDWAALRGSYAHFEHVVASSADLRTLFDAEAQQNVHRINLFADGVWALLSALVFAIGLHGICWTRTARVGDVR